MLTTKKNEFPVGLPHFDADELIRDTVRDLRGQKPRDEEPAWINDFIDRAMRAIPKAIAPLGDYSSVSFRKYLLDDHQLDIEVVEAELVTAASALVSAVRKALRSQEISSVANVVRKFRLLEGSATSLVTMLSIETEERSFSPLSRYTRNPSVDAKDIDAARAAAVRAKGVLVRVVAAAISGRTIFKRLVDRETETDQSEEVSHAARMRRLRARRRKGVVFRPTVNLYAGELDLLRHMGFLTAGDKDNKEAVEAALDAFIFAAFKAYPDEVSWVDRHRLLLDRTMAEKEEAEKESAESNTAE